MKSDMAKGLNEFAPPGDDGGNDDDGFDEATLKQLAAKWWNGDEDPRVEQLLMNTGWEIGQDEGYDNGGVFVVMSGDVNGDTYLSWPAEELQGVAEGICSECGGPSFSDMILAEKQDACYNKVKSRYKVWPSAYASGALVQCRKKGAANWGNKSEGVNEMDKSQTPPGRSGASPDSGKEYTAKPIKAKAFAKYAGDQWIKNLSKDQLDAIAGPRYKKKGVAEGFKNTYNVGDRVDGPLGTGTIVAVSKNINVDGRVKVKLDDPSRAGEDGKYKDSFVLDTTQLKHINKQGVAEGLPQTLRKVVPGYAKREIDRKMDAGKFGKTDTDKDANFQRYKKIQDKLKEQGVAEGSGNIGNKIQALYQKIHNAGDDAVEFMYYDSPIFAHYWEEYEGDLDSIIAEVDPSELEIILSELESAAEDQGVAEGAFDNYSPMAQQQIAKDKNQALKNTSADEVIRDLIQGSLDGYDVMAHPRTPAQKVVAKMMQEKYDDIAINHRLHPDDDFEEIISRVIDDFEEDYGAGLTEEQDLAEAVSTLELADFLFKGLEQKFPKVVERYGHEVVGDAIMDVAEENQDVNSVSDVDMLIDDIIEKLQNYSNSNSGLSESKVSRLYYNVVGTSAPELRKDFGMRRDSRGWFLSESSGRNRIMDAHRAFGSPKLVEYDLSVSDKGAATLGPDNVVSPIGTVPRGQQLNKKAKSKKV